MIDKGSRYVRIGDVEREAAASALGEHFAAGRLTHDEFDERLEQAWAARVGADLEPLFADLPPDRTTGKAARQQQLPPVYPAWAYPGRPPIMRRPGPPLFALTILMILVFASLAGGGLPFPLFIIGLIVLLKVIRGFGRRAMWTSHR